VLMSRFSQFSSSSQPIVTASFACSALSRLSGELMGRRAMSNISNTVNTIRAAALLRQPAATRRIRESKRNYYVSTRVRYAHPEDGTKCAYCRQREHAVLHHEHDFRRAGTGIMAPSAMTANQLEEEVKRCTRMDGTIGLVSLCLKCHKQAHLTRQGSSNASPNSQRSIARNKRLDKAAKLARGECECDAGCQRKVTEEDIDLFEWDHLVQSFDDPSYRRVGSLVTSGRSVAVCDRERAKCRLLYYECHR
jgi:hypothetical protein